MAPKQKPFVEKHCMGDCGKISAGGAIIDPLCGALMVCSEKTCPHEDEVLRDYGKTNSFGDEHVVHLRILKQDEQPGGAPCEGCQ